MAYPGRSVKGFGEPAQWQIPEEAIVTYDRLTLVVLLWLVVSLWSRQARRGLPRSTNPAFHRQARVLKQGEVHASRHHGRPRCHFHYPHQPARTPECHWSGRRGGNTASLQDV